jgi:hypothetical protein
MFVVWLATLALAQDRPEMQSFDLSPLRLAPHRPPVDLESGREQAHSDSADDAEGIAGKIMGMAEEMSKNVRWNVEGGMLHVEAPPDVVAFVGGMIRALGSRYAETIRVRGRFVRVDPKLWVGSEDPVKTLEQAGVLADLTVEAVPVQRSGNVVREEVTYVRDYNVQIGGQQIVYDPEIASVARGASLDVSVWTYPGREGVRLDVRGDYTGAQEPFPRARITDGPAPLEVELPVVRPLRFRTTVEVAPGETVVAGAALTDEGVVALVVSAERARGGRLEAVPRCPFRGLDHQLFEASVVSVIEDFEGPKLDPIPVPQQPGADAMSGVFFTIEEERWLWALFRKAEPEETRHVIFLGPWLYVRDKPEALREMERTLKAVAERRKTQIGSRAWVLSLPADALKGWDRRAEVHDETAARWLREGKVVAGADLRSLSGQRVHASSRTQAAYISDYTAQVGGQTVVLDAEIGVWTGGAVLDLRGTAAQEGLVSVEGRLQWAQTDGSRSVEVGRGAGIQHLPRARLETFTLDARGIGVGWRAQARRIGDEEAVLLTRVERK